MRSPPILGSVCLHFVNAPPYMPERMRFSEAFISSSYLDMLETLIFSCKAFLPIIESVHWWRSKSDRFKSNQINLIISYTIHSESMKQERIKKIQQKNLKSERMITRINESEYKEITGDF